MSPARAAAALGAVLVITAAWWMLALWPATPATPEWLLRTREVCFGVSPSGLPNAGGWILLVGQPLGMLLVLVAVWPAEVRAGLHGLVRRVAGQMVVGAAAAAIFAGLGGVVVRVAGADREPFSPGAGRDVARALTRIDDPSPEFALVDQHGRTITMDAFRGRPVLVTFAFAHCETVCPAIVHDVIEAQARLVEERPAVLILTLDPWRDTPGRLPAIAGAWTVPSDVHVLSGSTDDVERALNRWRVPRVRNTATGDLSHPSLVYVIGENGRIAYALTGHADAIVAAVRALAPGP